MNHILIINPNKDFFSNPTLVYILKKLNQEKNLKITLVIDSQKIATPVDFKAIQCVQIKSFRVSWPKKIWKWIPIIMSNFQLLWFCKKNNVTKIIGVDPIGLIVAGRIKQFFKKVELHYLSFEIFFRDEVKADKQFKNIKEQEIYYSQLVDVVVIQDEEREKLLIQENKFKNDVQFFQIPVAPQKYNVVLENRNELREKLGVKQNEILLLHSGNIADWTGGNIILNILKKGLPPDYKILIHSKYPLNKNNVIQAELIEMQKNGYPVILHDNPFPDYQNYLKFVMVADVGLALYAPDFKTPWTGQNIREIGLASGKFSTYMNIGLPTVTTNAKSFTELNEKYNFGAVIKNADELLQILKNGILKKADKNNCIRLFEEELNPDKFGVTYIQQLIS